MTDKYPMYNLCTDTLAYALFSIIIIDIDGGIECTLSKFAEDSELGGVVDTLEARVATQSNPDRLEEWANVNLMKFNRARCTRCIGLGQSPVSMQTGG